jgi:hypothetical protein
VQAIRDELAARARREHVQRVWLGVLSAALGRMDEAFELLDQACEERDGILPYAKRYPFFALLQLDPRMERIYRRVGLPDERRVAAEASAGTERPRRRGSASSGDPGLRAPEPPA